MCVLTHTCDPQPKYLFNSSGAINTQNFNHLRHFPKVPQGTFGKRIIAAKEIDIKNVLPRASLQRSRFDFAQADLTLREHSQRFEQRLRRELRPRGVYPRCG